MAPPPPPPIFWSNTPIFRHKWLAKLGPSYVPYMPPFLKASSENRAKFHIRLGTDIRRDSTDKSRLSILIKFETARKHICDRPKPSQTCRFMCSEWTPPDSLCADFPARRPTHGLGLAILVMTCRVVAIWKAASEGRPQFPSKVPVNKAARGRVSAPNA